MHPLVWLFLAGELAPIGYTISFLQRPIADVVDVIKDIRADVILEVEEVGGLPRSVVCLIPWKRRGQPN